MTARVLAAVSGSGFATANEPLGWFEYEVKDDAYAEVAKCCAVFSTKGDKRLGDHVIQGLERLLPLLIDGHRFDDKVFTTGVFAADRIVEDGEVMGTDMVATCEMGGYVDAVGVPLPERVPGQSLQPLEDRWMAVWESSAAALTQHLHEAGGSLLALVYWRFGWEAGLVLRAMHDQGISWGTYADDLGTHCNAHVNNFVILPEDPSNPTRRMLAPLDFDMAFTRSNFLLLSAPVDDPVAAAQLSAAQLDEWMLLERRGLECCLAGSDLNSGTLPLAPLPQHLVNLRWALRDTACSAFLAAFHSGNDALDPHPLTPQVSPAIHALIRLALLSTLEVIA